MIKMQSLYPLLSIHLIDCQIFFKYLIELHFSVFQLYKIDVRNNTYQETNLIPLIFDNESKYSNYCTLLRTPKSYFYRCY